MFRPPYTPVSIGALAGTHRGEDFRPKRLPPSHAWAQAQGAVFVETRAVAARAVFPQGRRDELAAERRARGRGRCARRSASATSRRSARSTCRAPTPQPSSIASTSTHSRRCRSGARATAVMLREDGFVLDDGTVSAARRAAFHRHDHDGTRGQGAGAPAVLPPGAVAGARRGNPIRDRAVGAVRGRGPALARRAAPSSSRPQATSATTLCPTWECAMS